MLRCLCLFVAFSLCYGFRKLNFHSVGNDVEYYVAVLENDSLKSVRVKSLEVAREQEAVAAIAFSNDVNNTGWAYLELWTDSNYDDTQQARAAGYLEGVATAELTYMHYYNTLKGFCDNRQEFCQKLSDYLKTNTEWVLQMIKKKRNNNPYWHQVGLWYEQLDGMAEAWSLIGEINDFGPLWLNIPGDLEDLSSVFGEPEMEFSKMRHHMRKRSRWEHVLGDGSCSALVKLMPDNKDLYVSHVTWNTYGAMIRILKRYNFGYHQTSNPDSELIPGSSMSFSSYPGVIYSMDDFHLMSNGLLSQETTIGNNNEDLWKQVNPVGQVLEGCRVVVANRLATNGREWTSIFRKHNSGTYNNQWMIVDYKLFKSGKKKLRDGLLWVLEQLPGHTKSEDATWRLRTEGYWPSYNSPYFEEIRDLSGTYDLIEKYGDWFTYDKTPRALIFKRDHHKVTDIESMIKLMRYNNYRNDPLSRCDCVPPYSAENAISARNDLNPRNGTYPFGSLSHRCHGGTDMKMTSYGMLKKLQFVAVNGPTHDPLPPFQWSKTDFDDIPRMGHPDLWKFKPVVFQWHSDFVL